MDKRLMAASSSTDKLWYAYRTDTDYAEMIGPEYLGTAGWHPDTDAGKSAALTRARLWYYWIAEDDLSVSRDRPSNIPDTDPRLTLEGWVNPLSVDRDDRPAVSARNFQIAERYRAARSAQKKSRNTETEKD